MWMARGNRPTTGEQSSVVAPGNMLQNGTSITPPIHTTSTGSELGESGYLSNNL